MKTAHLGAILASAAMLAACTTSGSEAALANYAGAQPAPVIVDLRVRENAAAPYLSVDQFTVPASHEIGDGIFPYEGIGWENGQIGYRLYLDGRFASDIFGKQVAEPVLAQIGEVGSYHELAAWGMDVLKVGPSLGIGGIGIMRGGEPVQFGSIPELSAAVEESGGAMGRFTVAAKGIVTPAGGTGGFTANFSIAAEGPMTLVSVTAQGDLPLATGIVMHDGAEFWQSRASNSTSWRYIATYGAQSENQDGLGIALFYRADQASYGGLANQTHYVTFGGPQFDYGFLAEWERGSSGVKDRASFDAILQGELSRLDQSQ